MVMKEQDFKKLRMAEKTVFCEKCRGNMNYTNAGIYKCEECGHETLDDFGKVKRYIELNGPTPAFIISQATGVSTDVINSFLREGRVEIPEGSDCYIKCEKCGCSIRYGRYCPECVKSLAGGIKSVLVADMGERPKNKDMSGKMHFLDKDNSKKK